MILVTGAGGYVASHLLPRLAERGLAVRALVRGDGAARLARYGFEVAQGDVTDRPSVDRAMRGVTTVVHLAAVNRARGAQTLDDVNHWGTVNTVEAAKAAGVRHFVNIIGLGANPSRPEGLARTQGMGLAAIQSSGLPHTVVTPSVIFGRGDEFINTIAGLIRVMPVLPVPGDGRALFQPIWVGDVVEGVIRALDDPARYQGVFPFGGPDVLTYNEIVDTIARVMGRRVVRVPMPVGLLRPAVMLMDAALPKPPVTPQLLDLLSRPNVAAPNTAQTVFGLRLTPLATGIDYVREMTAGQFISRTLGRSEYR